MVVEQLPWHAGMVWRFAFEFIRGQYDHAEETIWPLVLVVLTTQWYRRMVRLPG
jgi:hypothetical protein